MATAQLTFYHFADVLRGEEVSHAIHMRVTDRYWHAWWYASGVDDFTGSNVADLFAWEQGMAALNYHTEKVYFLDSIKDAYSTFRKNHDKFQKG